MNYLFQTNALLISAQFLGFLGALLLFGACFLGVHILKLAQVGLSQYKKNDPPPEPKEKPTPAPQEPIYYIVEKKQRRSKPSYGEPKKISFK